jgi:hypothetical protein
LPRPLSSRFYTVIRESRLPGKLFPCPGCTTLIRPSNGRVPYGLGGMFHVEEGVAREEGAVFGEYGDRTLGVPRQMKDVGFQAIAFQVFAVFENHVGGEGLQVHVASPSQ